VRQLGAQENKKRAREEANAEKKSKKARKEKAAGTIKKEDADVRPEVKHENVDEEAGHSLPRGVQELADPAGAPDEDEEELEAHEVLISGLPDDLSEQLFRQIFEAYGTIKRCRLFAEKKDGQKSGMIEFASAHEAKWLVEYMDGEVPVSMETRVSVKYLMVGGLPVDAQFRADVGRGGSVWEAAKSLRLRRRARARGEAPPVGPSRDVKRKPKRGDGACHSCGTFGHWARDCPERRPIAPWRRVHAAAEEQRQQEAERQRWLEEQRQLELQQLERDRQRQQDADRQRRCAEADAEHLKEVMELKYQLMLAEKQAQVDRAEKELQVARLEKELSDMKSSSGSVDRGRTEGKNEKRGTSSGSPRRWVRCQSRSDETHFYYWHSGLDITNELPPYPWEVKRSARTGDYYYLNVLTGETSVEKPEV